MNIKTASIAAISIVALIAAACSPKPGEELAAERPECPHSWADAFKPDSTTHQTPGDMGGWSTSGNPQRFLISQGITDIPEFHDCQRLIPNKEGAHAYGRLAAVFARDSLDSLVPALPRRTTRSPGGAAARPTIDPAVREPSPVESGPPSAESSGVRPVLPEPRVPQILAVAEIASEGSYESLGIGVGFNCLLLRYAGNDVSARMVAVGTDHRDFECVQLERGPMPSNAAVKDLEVLPSDFEQVPPVARWEWDIESNRQLIGVKCGQQHWCVIGPDDPPHPVRSRGLDGAPQGMTAPGWYDEQSLAVPLTDGSTPGGAAPTLMPSGPFSTIFPDEALEQFRRDSYPRHTWIPAAHIAMPLDAPVYGAKLGLARTSVALPASSLAGLNQLQLCIGTIESCKVRMTDINDPVASGCTKAYLDRIASTPADARKLPVWARIIPPDSSADSPKTRYHCVTHREHPGVFIPAVVRWRWRVDDETIWAYCPSGCCEVHSSPE